jgi:hypothetical protein
MGQVARKHLRVAVDNTRRASLREDAEFDRYFRDLMAFACGFFCALVAVGWMASL